MNEITPFLEARLSRSFALACLCISSLLLGGCASTTSGGAVGADRKQVLLISSDRLNSMASQSYLQVKSEASEEGTLNRDAAMVERVRLIANRLQSQTGVYRSDAVNWDWEVNVIESDQLNAFCMPGGKIMFYSGIITQLNLTDAEIATVMGHEIAHALREHSREQMSKGMVAQGVIGIGSALLGVGSTSTQTAGMAYQALVATKFSRNHESEADRMGLELAARAAYDPRAGVTLWQKMTAANSGSRPPEILSSHPAGENRVKEIEALLPTVLPLYEAAR